MADFVGVPYSSIIGRAVLPAVLYFLGIFISVHLEAKKLKLTGIPKSELPKFTHLEEDLPFTSTGYAGCMGFYKYDDHAEADIFRYCAFYHRQPF